MPVVLQYHKTKIAYAPKIISDLINKYSVRYRSVDSSVITISQKSKFDLVHFHNRYESIDKPSLIQYHSEPLPSLVMLDFPGPRYCIPQYPALYGIYSPSGYIRNIIDLENPIYKYEPISGKVRVAYTPSTVSNNSRYSNKGYNETIQILQNVKHLHPDRFDFNVVVSSSLEESLRVKSLSNVVIDECITGSYHRSALEGLAMGKLTIVYVQPEIEDLFISCSTPSPTPTIPSSPLPITPTPTPYFPLPYKNISIFNLERYLLSLVDESLDQVLSEGYRAWEWMRSYWHHLTLINELEKIYDSLIN